MRAATLYVTVSVRWSVGWSVGRSVGNTFTFMPFWPLISLPKSLLELYTSFHKSFKKYSEKKFWKKKFLKKIFVSTAYLANNEHPNIIIGGLKVIFQVLQTNFICFLPRVFEISWILSSNGLLILSPQEAHTNKSILYPPTSLLQA